MSRLPLWLQAIAILLLGDLIGYWMHRGFHGARLWRVHAVHHSSVDLDRLSAVRRRWQPQVDENWNLVTFLSGQVRPYRARTKCGWRQPARILPYSHRY